MLPLFGYKSDFSIQPLIEQMPRKSDPRVDEKFERLKALIPQIDRLMLLRLKTTVILIEHFGEKLFIDVNKSKDYHLYVRPENRIDTNLHLILCYSENKERQIFIVSKHRFLGKGLQKKVWAGIDYINEVEIAVASLKPSLAKPFSRVKKEYLLQKSFGEATDLCIYLHEKSGFKFKIVMPLANWGSLEKATLPLGHETFLYSLSDSQRENLFYKIIERVAEIHEKNCVIADIKPANLLLHVARGEVSIKITDFGLAYLDNDCSARRLVGTSPFLAPELMFAVQYNKNFEGSSLPCEVFALGRSLWEIFLGGPPPWMINIPPLDAKAYIEAWTHQTPFPKNSLEHLIYRMTSPNREERPTLKELITNKPSFKFSSPFYQDKRLLTEEESIQRFQLNEEDFLEKFSDAVDPSHAYTLNENHNIRSNRTIVSFEPLEGKKVKVEEKIYESLEDYLYEAGLTTCLNFYT